MNFDEEMFERVVKAGSYPRKSVEKARRHLIFDAKVKNDSMLELEGILPSPDYPTSKTGGSGMRASPAGPAAELEALADLLQAYHDARWERRTQDLVDLLKDDLWGDRERSLQVFQCRVCGSLSNRITSYRYQGRTSHCLGAANDPLIHVTTKDWHRLASDKLYESRRIVHPASYRAELRREVSELIKDRPFKNDLVGDPAPVLVHFTFDRTVIRCTGPDDGYAHYKDWETER